MAEKNKVMVFLSLCFAGIMVVPFIASCGKSAGSVTPSSAKILMQVVNLSPDLQPVNLYVGLIQQSTGGFTYPTPSGYFSLTNINPPIQIRSYSSVISTVNLVNIDSVVFKPNFKYTLFVTGLRTTNTVTSIFTVDTAVNPTTGRGKVRFVNASPGSGMLDITANDTLAFKASAYKSVSKFVELPAGNYNFRVKPSGTSTIISNFQSVTIVDGKLYTLYCRGVVNGADSVAFGMGIINNR